MLNFEKSRGDEAGKGAGEERRIISPLATLLVSFSRNRRISTFLSLPRKENQIWRPHHHEQTGSFSSPKNYASNAS